MTGIDWAVIVIYLAGVIAFGLWMGRKQTDMKDYFLGSRRIPWWAALLSMVATEISAATFLGAPEQGYVRDLTYLQIMIGSVVARFALAFLFLGVYYRFEVYTVYGFLTHRFGFPTKNAAAGAFMLGRLFAGGSRLFIASLAVKVVTGFDLLYSIILLGTVAILYTLIGGIKAVIWTDVVQAIVLAGGAIASIVVLLGEIPLGTEEVIGVLSSHDKLRLFDTRWLTDGHSLALFSNPYHFLPALIGGFFLTMATHGTDQSMVQRLLTCKDSFRGKLSLVMSGFVGLAVTALFMAVGLLLFVYVQNLPPGDHLLAIAQELHTSGHNGDFYLHYILHGLPPGVSGLIMASVFAAAMSSIDSELNAMSATFVNDFYKPYFAPHVSMRHYLRVAKIATFVVGALLIAVAGMVAEFYLNNPDTDLLSIALGVMTFFYGGLLGIFLLGLLTKSRGSSLTNVLALILSVLTIVGISYKTQLLSGLGIYDPANPSSGFVSWLYHARLAWPWFTVVGAMITIAVATLGATARGVTNTVKGAKM